MNVPTITMPANEARERFDEYAAALEGREPTAEDAACLLGYKALANGRDLLDAQEVFRTCPLDELGRPKLAIGRASWSVCFFEAGTGDLPGGRQGRRIVFASAPEHFWRKGNTGKVILAPPQAQPGRKLTDSRLRAIVPSIPPTIRPRSGLHRYHVLWEAAWECAPVDPILLRHLTGALYVILASWDLTPLERAVLGGRLA